MTEQTAIYRHFDRDGALLYVGVTNNPKRRLAEHKSRAVWRDEIHAVSVKWLRSRDDALAAEAEAIETERPIFNGGEAFSPVPTGDAFRDWLASERISQGEIAQAYGVSQPTLSRMVAGKCRVSLRFAAFIEDASEGAVPMRYWIFGITAEHRGSVEPSSEDAA